MHALPILSAEPPPWLAGTRAPHQDHYFAMYSSVLGGIVTDPVWMSAPADDHLVHRGDGVFETLKCVNGRIYLGREHVTRLFTSAEMIGLVPPWSHGELLEIVRQTIRAGLAGRDGPRDCLVRILLSRGPGSLGVNPYDCPRPALYVTAYRLSPPFMDAHPGGARCRTSAIPVKPGVFATAKTCNYLPNALMKKEAVDAGVDFTISFDENGKVAEGATENIGVLTARRELLVPNRRRILSGMTMMRVMDLAQPLVRNGTLARIGHHDLSRDDLANAAEAYIFGTTPDVTAVVEFDGCPIGDGRPGPVWRLLADLLHRDLFEGREHHIDV